MSWRRKKMQKRKKKIPLKFVVPPAVYDLWVTALYMAHKLTSHRKALGKGICSRISDYRSIYTEFTVVHVDTSKAVLHHPVWMLPAHNGRSSAFRLN